MKDETQEEMAAICATGETGETGETGATGETVADIVREMRSEAPQICEWGSFCIGKYADRIERAVKNVENAFGMALAIEDGLHKRDKQSATYNAAAMREALERILDIEGYGAPWLEAKCIAQKALEGQQCTPPIAQETAKIEHPGNAAALRPAGRKTGAPKK